MTAMNKLFDYSSFARNTPQWAFKQGARRWLVVANFVGVVGLVNPLKILSPPLAVILLTLFFLSALFSMTWIMGATHVHSELRENMLDERETHNRNRAYYIAFRVLLLMIALLGVVSLILVVSQISMPTISIGELALGSIVFVSILPTYVLAWIQPDPISDLES
jgi:DoxX-like family